MTEIKLGNHSLEERELFLARKIADYIHKHPNIKPGRARKYARIKWARKVNAELKKTQHINKIKVVKK